jgi:hypothetical protein
MPNDYWARRLNAMTELLEVGTGEASDAETGGAVDAPTPTTWTFQDLGDVLDGKAKRIEATMFRRSDGVPLIYPGKTHAFVGESESMKSWAALAACAERLMLGEVVLYVDFEDTKFTFVERLLDLGVPKDVIRDKAAYIRPSEPLKGDREKSDLRTVRDRYATPVLVILDGVTECMTLHGWDPNVGTDVVKFLDVYPRYMSSTGAAIVFIDHVAKASDSRGRYAIGSVHKLNGIDGASYTFEGKQPFGRGMSGLSTVSLNKDRPGFVRPHASNRKIADMRAVSSPDDGSVIIALEPPVSAADWRPTVFMERISRLLEEAPEPMGVRAIREAVTGQTKHKDQALKFLIEDGYVEAEAGPRGAKLHRSVKPYRDNAEPTGREVVAGIVDRARADGRLSPGLPHRP